MVVVAAMACSMAACGPGEMGPQGPQGAQGPQGTQGVKGDTGPGVASAKLYACEGFSALAGGVGVYVGHIAYVFPDGSVMTSCEVEGPIYSIGATRLFRAGKDIGTTTAHCSVVYDVETGNGGFWEFAMNAARTSTVVTYVDEGSQYDGRKVTLPCTAY